MKVDRSLQEVWDWKDALYQETKNMNWEERAAHLRKKADTIEKKYHLNLRKVTVKHSTK